MGAMFKSHSKDTYQSRGRSLQLPPSLRFPPLREGNRAARAPGSPCPGGTLRRGSSTANAISVSYPVCPKPPSPRSDGGSSRTGVHSIRLTGATTSCAIRSPRRIVNGSCPQLMRMTCTSPR